LYKNLIFSVENNIAILTINRPEVRNAISLGTVEEINAVLDSIEKDQSIRVLIVTGSGDRAFVSGGDLKEFEQLVTIEDGRRMSFLIKNTLNRLENLEIPVIAAINGVAYGGGSEVALACDYRIAADSAKLGLLQVKLAIMTSWGGGPRLARLIGRSKALALLTTGDILKAEQALEMGIVDQVVEPAELLDAAKDLAGRMAANSPLAVRYAKLLLNDQREMSFQGALNYESELFSVVWASEDHTEAVNALKEKRKPNFKGR